MLQTTPSLRATVLFTGHGRPGRCFGHARRRHMSGDSSLRLKRIRDTYAQLQLTDNRVANGDSRIPGRVRPDQSFWCTPTFSQFSRAPIDPRLIFRMTFVMSDAELNKSGSICGCTNVATGYSAYSTGFPQDGSNRTS